ncbi:LCP family protein [Corynebacterium flavescens]|uniref:Cell envelope-related transcriptional attenuator domain-containing protein n=2 Tax=Corynebacterium flavescens TaxID=28028 RepID=A0AB73B9V4_CORFL|nr:LCP family protein [Corynebacterium flavescens]KAA8719810.1 LytR family transcriptional regulator [Corynebacterium flavescens]GEB98567.1 hypothetical protein CFL01nite_20620 [Corynebacterium flavescens]
MTDSGRDPRREARRAGDARSEEFVLGADGRPLTDRYGRPVRRRKAANPQRRPPRAEPHHESFPAVHPQETRFDLGSTHSAHEQRRPLRGQQPQQYRPQQYRTDRPDPYRTDRPRQYRTDRPDQYSPEQRRSAGPQVPRNYSAPPRSAVPHRRRKKKAPVRVIGGCMGWGLAIILVLALVFTLWTDARLTRVNALPEQRVANTAGTNWLLVGSDSRQGLTEQEQEQLGTGGDIGVGRTDTIMLLHIPRSGKAQLVSIPRDSYVEVPGFGMDKINAAFTYGGPQLLTQTVEQSTGLRVDHYAEIGMGGLANVVDAVGGVELCVAEPIDDPLAGINLGPGCQKMQGPEALGYVRTRATALGDLDRVQRQRDFFAALLHKITSPGTLINPFRMVSLVNQTASSFIVGSKDHVWHLARVALAMGSGVETQTVPIGGFQDTEVGNVVLWDDAATAQLWDSMR